MALNHQYWTRIFRSEFSHQLSTIVNALEKRVLPSFEGIEQEAEAVGEETWNDLMSQPATGNEDTSDIAERAEDAKVSYYQLLSGIRQGILNLFAAALYHAFEQQVLLFHRKEVLPQAEENNVNYLKTTEFLKRLNSIGVEISTFSTWPKLNELRLVANTVKHAEGPSSRKLYGLRPDLFEHPLTREFISLPMPTVPVFQPLVGDDLYVSFQDIRDYEAALLQFWEELSDAMK